MDNELLLVWQLVNELSEQLAHNQKITTTLKSQAGALKVNTSLHLRSTESNPYKSKEHASEATAGFTLRRVNADISEGP
jgi:hypothetical protein